MINITKQEAISLRTQLPDVHIRRTVKKYYVEETSSAINTLNKIRNAERSE